MPHCLRTFALAVSTAQGAFPSATILCSPSPPKWCVLGGGCRAVPKPPRCRSWRWAWQDGKARGYCWPGRHLDTSLEKATERLHKGEQKPTKQAAIINCPACCPRFVEDLSGLISSGETVMCVSNYPFKSKHYLYHRALRRSLARRVV